MTNTQSLEVQEKKEVTSKEEKTFPARYFVQALHTVFLAGDVPVILVRDGAALCGFAALFFALTARITRKKLA